MRDISPEELKQNDGRNGARAWVAYNGLVYDVTDSPLFRNGKHFRHQAGADLTAELQKAPHTDRVFAKFPPIGKLVQPDEG
ncbi:MAG: cytochrome b5 domain-containing protein [Bacteroidia bacterium]|nr:cytochrome b5 [Bacteroidia bacterium]MDW8333465.1 cytochrome b5 domain-containing protein [Bacteroidia bacterium]